MNNYSYNPTPSDREINLNPSMILSYKINVDGIIEYANHQFSEISGYEEFELIGETMDKFRHPDMPKIFYHILMERLEKKEPMRIFSKLLAKDGRYFWVMTDYETKVDDEGNIVAHYGNSKPAPKYAVHKIDSLNSILAKIEEKTGDVEASKRYLIGFLEERNMTYNKFIEDLSQIRPEYEQPFSRQPIEHLESDEIARRNLLYSNDRPVEKTVQPSLYNNNPLTKKEQPPQKKKKSLLKIVFGK